MMEQIRESANCLRQAFPMGAELGIVLGSGLGPLADELTDAAAIPFAEVPHFARSTAPDHAGRLVCGTLAGKRVLCMQGRLHGYEGLSPAEVAYPIRVMKAFGLRSVILTNAAGGINLDFAQGDLMVIDDHINFTGRNPIVGTEPDEIAFRFFSMLDCYDPELRNLAQAIADREAIPVQQGVYLGLLGPSFETPAEIRAFRTWGADTVAMSVCEEVIAARHVGMRVLGISLCSNMACGIEGASPSDIEVFEVAEKRSADFCKLITCVVEEM